MHKAVACSDRSEVSVMHQCKLGFHYLITATLTAVVLESGGAASPRGDSLIMRRVDRAGLMQGESFGSCSCNFKVVH